MAIVKAPPPNNTRKVYEALGIIVITGFLPFSQSLYGGAEGWQITFISIILTIK